MNTNSALLKELETAVRNLNYSKATFDTYRGWVIRFCHWLKRQNQGEWIHPRECGRVEVEEFCSYLANGLNLAGKSQNTALAALLFLFKHVIKQEVVGVDAVRAKTMPRLPRAISPADTDALMRQLTGQAKLVAQLLYGCGMRIGECLELRIKDVDIDQRQIMIRGKGDKSRLVGMPRSTVDPLTHQIAIVERWYQKDVRNGCNRVELPNAFARKSPRASGQFMWYWLFASHVNSRHPREGWMGRWHVDPSNIGRSITIAATKAGIRKRVSPHTLRHSYATHMIAAGVPVATVQKLMGHARVETTMGYVHLDPNGITASPNPLDRLADSA